MVKSFLLIVLCFVTISVQAKSIFTVDMTVGGVNKVFGYSKIEDVLNAVKLSQITSQFPSYAPSTDQISIKLDFRGLPMTLANHSVNKTWLVLNVSAIGLVNKTFEGATIDQSNDLLEDWLKKDGGAALNDLMKKLAEFSPIDPLAGNPNSLMGSMVGDDFDTGSRPPAGQVTDGGGFNENLLGIGFRVGKFDQNGLDGRTLTLPIEYTARLDFNPRHQIIFNLPITLYQVEDATSFNVRMGLAYRFPVTNNWYITPAVGTGVTGSVDLGSAGLIKSFSLSSGYQISFERFRLGLGNMLGHYSTNKIKIASYESDPKIANTVARNGLFFSMPHPLFGMEVESEIFFFDTRYFGDKLYMDQYNEVGYSLGANKARTDLKKLVRLGISYLFASEMTGFTFNFGYSF